MRLISKNAELAKNLLRLIDNYPNISFAVAWASSGTIVFDALYKNQERIKKAVIGTHFYQTHPDVLDAFVKSNRVHFMLQPQGVFHPKIYVFWDSKNWEILVGSANLTVGALKSNAEAMFLISSKDQIDVSLKSDALALIQSYFEDARSVDKETALSYKAHWEKQQPALHRLSGQYGQALKSKAPADSEIMSMSWSSFYSQVKNDSHHGFKERCDLLNSARNLFRKYGSFQKMETEERKFIAGLPVKINENWGWFGSMKGAGYYKQAIKNNNPHISNALDNIPLDGLVLRENYEAFIREFIKAFPNGGDGVAVASRLLALKRPDYFVCIDSKNNKSLCLDFQIKKSGMNYERYWSEIIERIADSIWWNSARPKDRQAAAVWDGRAAMLDAIFYKP